MAFGLNSLVYGLLIVGILLAISLVVLAENHTQIEAIAGANSYAANASDDVQEGIGGVSGWIPLIVVVSMAAVVVAVVKGSFGGGRA